MKTEKPLECPIIAGYPVNSINERGFGNVPTRVMDDVRLSIGARCLYSLLASHAGSQHEAWPGVRRIIATLGCSENSFYKYRQELSDLGYVKIETRNTRYGRRTVYVLEQIVPYVSIDGDDEKGFSTIPSSEPYLKNCGMASEDGYKDDGTWKSTGGKPSHTAKSEGSHTSKFEVQNNINGIETKNSTTSQPVDNLQSQQCGTANAEPVVSSPTAPSSSLDLDSEKKDEEAPLALDAVDAAFYELEARSLCRTRNGKVRDKALASYRSLVREGHSIEDIAAAYNNYLEWCQIDDVKLPHGFKRWLEEDFKRNDDEAKEKRAAAAKMGSTPKAANPTPKAAADDAEYLRKSEEVKKVGGDDAEYRVEYAEQSNDERLRRLAACIRAEKPRTFANGIIDERLGERPSYGVLWVLTNDKEHQRDYVLWAYERLKAERKVH